MKTCPSIVGAARYLPLLATLISQELEK